MIKCWVVNYRFFMCSDYLSYDIRDATEEAKLSQVCLLTILGIEPRAPSMLLKSATADLCPQQDLYNLNVLKSWEVERRSVENSLWRMVCRGNRGVNAGLHVIPGAALPGIDLGLLNKMWYSVTWMMIKGDRSLPPLPNAFMSPILWWMHTNIFLFCSFANYMI